MHEWGSYWDKTPSPAQTVINPEAPYLATLICSPNAVRERAVIV